MLAGAAEARFLFGKEYSRTTVMFKNTRFNDDYRAAA